MRNETGVNGVANMYNAFGVHIGYVAQWDQNYVRKTKNFRFSVHGVDGTLDKAADYRDLMEAKCNIQSRRRILGLSTVEYNEEEQPNSKKKRTDIRETVATYYQQGEREPSRVEKLTGIHNATIRHYFNQFMANGGIEKPALKSPAEVRIQKELIARLYVEGIPPGEAAQRPGAPTEASINNWYRILRAGQDLFTSSATKRKQLAITETPSDPTEPDAARPAKRQRTLDEAFAHV